MPTPAVGLRGATTTKDEPVLPKLICEIAPDDATRLSLRITYPAAPPPLSTLLPRLEHLGLLVLDCTRGQADTAERVFSCRRRLSGAVAPELASAAFTTVAAHALAGRAEDDAFNGLAWTAGLALREIALLRAYARYLRQLGAPWSTDEIAAALCTAADFAHGLVDLFALRLAPGSACATRAAAAAARLAASLNERAPGELGQILRRCLNLVEATVRSNWFQRDAAGRPPPCIALKLDCARVEGMPAPRPWREISVCGPHVEGVHLRGGAVARGGLRFSDRARDFRTEVLELFRAQQVKNAVIVPAGAKGGFTLRGGGASDPATVERAYRDFVSALLDVTDTRDETGVRPLIAGSVRLDGDDPYLVVAADKGTARFSDLANAVAARYGYWLGDAFASGGSAGYDHKRMGITARGAWEAVRRHFRELGTNVDEQTVRAAGVGDMSGDVFGNGMLLAPRLALIAAFDHRHIFLDPMPELAAAYAERRRLFTLPRSSWDDYDRALISAGGGVWRRDAPSIPLAPAARRALGVEAEALAPDALIRALLCAPVDLLWFGGIGTYVKADDEGHDAAADHGNDAVRVDAADLRCRVLGEGANLALTRRARVALALAGVRLNTDAIDNAAGVNCSDHEVNIKILLELAIRDGRLARDARDALLAAIEGDVARLVIRDNYLQTQALSLAEAQAPARLERHRRLIALLERGGQLDRILAGLPDEETLHERQLRGRGLVRPELAALLAHTKLSVAQALLASDMPDDPQLMRELEDYFPAPLRELCRGLFEHHPLRREILVNRLVNGMINRVGSGFVNDMMNRAACDDAAVARAWMIVCEVFGLRAVWCAIEALDNLVPAAVQTSLLGEVGALVESVTAWLLDHEGAQLDIGSGVARYARPVEALIAALPEVLGEAERDAFGRQVANLCAAGVPGALAARIAALRQLGAAGDIVHLASSGGLPIEGAARLYYAVGARTGLASLCPRLRSQGGSEAGAREALDIVERELLERQARLCETLLASTRAGAETERVEAWARTHAAALTRLVGLAAAAVGEHGIVYPPLVILTREWRRMLDAA
ncbi:MAG TPA: NAD-glutamate dehydrogenase [Gammaproteobacteria bacterium]|nr:NAD-glutamate dehydrogenase [Gammaproteobacteria bacterium]